MYSYSSPVPPNRIDAIRTGDKSNVLTPVQMSLDSHLMAFAAEKSRRDSSVVEIEELIKAC